MTRMCGHGGKLFMVADTPNGRYALSKRTSIARTLVNVGTSPERASKIMDQFDDEANARGYIVQLPMTLRECIISDLEAPDAPRCRIRWRANALPMFGGYSIIVDRWR